MTGTETLTRARWLHCTCRQRVCECTSYRFGWLCALDKERITATVIDVTGRVAQVDSSHVETKSAA